MRPVKHVQHRAKAAISMRISGAPIDKIAEVCGYADAEEAQKAIEKALSRVAAPEDFESARHLYVARLDALLNSCWDQAVDQDNPEQISYIKTVLAIEERRAKLTGADAPTKHEIYTPTAEQIEAHVNAYASSHPQVIVEAEIVEELPADRLDADPLELEQSPQQTPHQEYDHATSSTS